MRRSVVGLLGLLAGLAAAAAVGAPPAGAAAPPTIASTSRPAIGQGGTATVVVTGTGFVTGAKVSVAGVGITAGRTSFVSSTTLAVRLTVASTAPTGPRALTVTNPDLQAATCSTCLTVTPAPVITGITRFGVAFAALGAGVSKVPVTVTGTGFQTGMVIRSSGGLSMRVWVESPTQAGAWVSTSRYAVPGPRTLTPINRDTGRSTCGCFTVNARPTISSVGPVELGRGEMSTLTITGTGFQPGASVGLGGNGANLLYVLVDSSTQLRAVMGLEPDALRDTRSVTVVNPDFGWALSAPTVVVSDVAYVYGDSVTDESVTAISAAGDAVDRWIVRPHAYGGTAPCDWVGWLRDDLYLHNPKRVTLMTMGNWNTNSAACTARGADPSVAVDSAEYLAAYRSWVEEFIAVAEARGVKVMLVAAPPAAATVRNSAISHLNAMFAEMAAGDPMVTYVTSVRAALSVGEGFVDHLSCLPNETAAMGCTGGLIPVRTLPPAIDAGLHLCPTGLSGLSHPLVCSVYSSGSQRYATAIVDALVAAGP